MSTRVDIEEVIDFRDTTHTQIGEIRDGLNEIRSHLENLRKMESFSGQAADQAKQYIHTFHLTMLNTFDSVFTDLLFKLNHDLQTFRGEVDRSSQTRLNSNDLLDIQEDIRDDDRALSRGHAAVRSAILSVSDISNATVPAIKNMSQDQETVLNHLSDLHDDLATFNERKRHSQLEGVLTQLNQTLNQTKKVSGPARLSHYKGLITNDQLKGLHSYQNAVRQLPEYVPNHPGIQAQIEAENAMLREELKNYQVYARIYLDLDGNPAVAWQLEDKITGYGVRNPKLHRYLQREGHTLDPEQFQFMTQEEYLNRVADGWRKGVNYVTGETLVWPLNWIVGGSQYIQDTVTWLYEDELGQAIQILGFVYASYRVTTKTGIKQVGLNETKHPHTIQKEKVLQNIEASKQARDASNFDQYLHKEQRVLGGVKENSGVNFNRLDDFIKGTGNAPVPTKPGGGSNPKDFVNPHSEKHMYEPSRPSTPNRSQYGENVDVAKLRQETMTNPDKAYSNWPNPNNPNPNKITKYYKEFDGNISTPDTPTGSHRVFENLDDPTRSSHFPYVPRK